MWNIRTGYAVARVNGRTLGRFDTLDEAQHFAAHQEFETEIIPFTDEELV